MDPTKYRETGNDQAYPSPPSSPRQMAEASKQYQHGKTLLKAKCNPLGSLGSHGCMFGAEGTQQQDGHCKPLQDRFQVNGGLCGAMTKNDKPCRWRKVRNRERIESLINSMANLTCVQIDIRGLSGISRGHPPLVKTRGAKHRLIHHTIDTYIRPV